MRVWVDTTFSSKVFSILMDALGQDSIDLHKISYYRELYQTEDDKGALEEGMI